MKYNEIGNIQTRNRYNSPGLYCTIKLYSLCAFIDNITTKTNLCREMILRLWHDFPVMTLAKYNNKRLILYDQENKWITFIIRASKAFSLRLVENNIILHMPELQIYSHFTVLWFWQHILNPFYRKKSCSNAFNLSIRNGLELGNNFFFGSVTKYRFHCMNEI